MKKSKLLLKISDEKEIEKRRGSKDVLREGKRNMELNERWKCSFEISDWKHRSEGKSRGGRNGKIDA